MEKHTRHKSELNHVKTGSTNKPHSSESQSASHKQHKKNGAPSSIQKDKSSSQRVTRSQPQSDFVQSFLKQLKKTQNQFNIYIDQIQEIIENDQPDAKLLRNLDQVNNYPDNQGQESQDTFSNGIDKKQAKKTRNLSFQLQNPKKIQYELSQVLQNLHLTVNKDLSDAAINLQNIAVNPLQNMLTKRKIKEISPEREEQVLNLKKNNFQQEISSILDNNKSDIKNNNNEQKDQESSEKKLKSQQDSSQNNDTQASSPIKNINAVENNKNKDDNIVQNGEKFSKAEKIKILKEGLTNLNIKNAAQNNNISPSLLRLWRTQYGNEEEIRELNEKYDQQKFVPKVYRKKLISEQQQQQPQEENQSKQQQQQQSASTMEIEQQQQDQNNQEQIKEDQQTTMEEEHQEEEQQQSKQKEKEKNNNVVSKRVTRQQDKASQEEQQIQQEKNLKYSKVLKNLSDSTTTTTVTRNKSQQSNNSGKQQQQQQQEEKTGKQQETHEIMTRRKQQNTNSSNQVSQKATPQKEKKEEENKHYQTRQRKQQQNYLEIHNRDNDLDLGGGGGSRAGRKANHHHNSSSKQSSDKNTSKQQEVNRKESKESVQQQQQQEEQGKKSASNNINKTRSKEKEEKQQLKQKEQELQKKKQQQEEEEEQEQEQKRKKELERLKQLEKEKKEKEQQEEEEKKKRKQLEEEEEQEALRKKKEEREREIKRQEEQVAKEKEKYKEIERQKELERQKKEEKQRQQEKERKEKEEEKQRLKEEQERKEKEEKEKQILMEEQKKKEIQAQLIEAQQQSDFSLQMGESQNQSQMGMSHLLAVPVSQQDRNRICGQGFDPIALVGVEEYTIKIFFKQCTNNNMRRFMDVIKEGRILQTKSVSYEGNTYLVISRVGGVMQLWNFCSNKLEFTQQFETQNEIYDFAIIQDSSSNKKQQQQELKIMFQTNYNELTTMPLKGGQIQKVSKVGMHFVGQNKIKNIVPIYNQSNIEDSLLAVSYGNVVCLVNMKGKQIFNLKMENQVQSVQFSEMYCALFVCEEKGDITQIKFVNKDVLQKTNLQINSSQYILTKKVQKEDKGAVVSFQLQQYLNKEYVFLVYEGYSKVYISHSLEIVKKMRFENQNQNKGKLGYKGLTTFKVTQEGVEKCLILYSLGKDSINVQTLKF